MDLREWKLRPIIDAIETGQYRHAVMLADKWLKKLSNDTGDAPIVKAAKSLALFRMGKQSEGRQLALDIASSSPPPSDDATLQFLSLTLQAAGEHAKILDLYSHAFNSCSLPGSPTHQELGAHLFMAAVRLDDYKLMQQTALKLNKLWGAGTTSAAAGGGSASSRYYLWVVMSVYLQSKQAVAAASTSPNIYLPLAEKMIIKALEQNLVKDYEALYLLLTILKDQQKWHQAIEYLQSPSIGIACCKIDKERQLLLADFYKCASVGSVSAGGMDFLVKARDLYADMFCESPDDTSAFKEYLDLLFKLSSPSFSSPFPSPRDSAMALLDKVGSPKSADGKRMRGPYIAALMLECWLVEQEVGDEKVSSSHDRIIACITNYFSQYGHAYCFFEDVSPFLPYLSSPHNNNTGLSSLLEPALVQLADRIYPRPPSVDSAEMGDIGGCNPRGNAAGQVKYIAASINLQKVKRYIQTTATTATSSSNSVIEEAVTSLYFKYRQSIRSSAHLLAKEKQYGDDFLILLVHVLIDEYVRGYNGVNTAEAVDRKESVMHLYHALAILEYGISKSAFNDQMKLLLIRIYYEIGVFNRPFDSIMPTLEIKQLLYDTLSWVYADGAKYLAYGSSVLDETVSVMKRVQSIYLSNEKETPEMIVKAFQFSTFSKITEFQSFRDRLRFSVNKRILATQLAHAIIRIRFLSTAKIVNPKLFVDAVAGMVAGVADTGHQGGKGGLDVEDEEYWERMAENRDLGIMVNWSSNKTPIQNQLHDVGVAHHGATPLLDRRIIKIEALIVKLLRAVLESDKVYCTKAVEPLDNLADQLQQSDTWAPSSPLKFTAKLLCSAGRCIDQEFDGMPQLMAEIEADMANVFTGLAVDDWRCMSMTIMAAGCKYLEVIAVALLIGLCRLSAITPPEAKKLVAKVPDSLKSYFINISRLVNVMESPYKVLESRVDQVNTFNLSKQMFSLDKEARPNMVEMLDNIEAYSELVAKNAKKSWLLSLRGLLEELQNFGAILSALK